MCDFCAYGSGDFIQVAFYCFQYRSRLRKQRRVLKWAYWWCFFYNKFIVVYLWFGRINPGAPPVVVVAQRLLFVDRAVWCLCVVAIIRCWWDIFVGIVNFLTETKIDIFFIVSIEFQTSLLGMTHNVQYKSFITTWVFLIYRTYTHTVWPAFSTPYHSQYLRWSVFTAINICFDPDDMSIFPIKQLYAAPISLYSA